MILRVTKYGEPILLKKGDTVKLFNKELEQLASDMIETMYVNEGMGLAAQQVDEDKMICVVDIWFPPDDERADERANESFTFDDKSPPLELIMPLVMVNPVITTFPGESSVYEEGCLSFPEIKGNVIRPNNIEVTFQDLKGGYHKIQSSSFLGRVIQHEVDHLDGILFIDRMDKESVGAIKPELKKLKRQSRDFLNQEKSMA